MRIIHLYLQMSCSKIRKHTSSESICRIFSSRISSSIPVLYNTINMTLRQQSGIVRLKYTLHGYMHKLCAREIHVTTTHHCMRIYLTNIFVRFWHTNRTHFETLYLASDRYCIHMYMFMYNVELLINRHVTDIMTIIILRFLLSLYLWLHCEFRALVIHIYMTIVHCIYMYMYTYIITYTYLFCTSCPQCVLCQLAIIGRCGLYTSNSPSPPHIYLSLSWPLMYMNCILRQDCMHGTYLLHVYVNLCDLNDCVCMYYILTAGGEMLNSPDYSLMSITVLQMSGTMMDGLLFTMPASEYLICCKSYKLWFSL